MTHQPGTLDLLRTAMALRLLRWANWLLGQRQPTRDEQLGTMRDALGDVTTLLPADHPACQAALRGLAADDPVRLNATSGERADRG